MLWAYSRGVFSLVVMDTVETTNLLVLAAGH